MGEKLVKKIREIPTSTKVAFIATFLIGMITHMYAFTHQVQNHDYYENVYVDQFWWPLSLGRCFLWPFTTISSYFSLPWVLGLLSVLYMSIAMCFLVSYLKVERTVPIILCGGLVMAHPAMTDLVGYLFTMDGYCVGFLAAVIAVWCYTKWAGVKKYLAFGGFATLSIGIYQADLSILLYLICIKVILDVYAQGKVSKDVQYVRKLIKDIGIEMLLLVASFVTYFGILKLLQWILGTPMASYAGFNTASLPDIPYLFQILKKDLLEFAQKFFGMDFKLTAYELLNIVFWAGFVVLNVWMIIRQRLYRRVSNLLLIVVAFVVMVYATSIFEFASDSIFYRWEMMLCVAFWYVLFVILADCYLEGWKRMVSGILSGIICFNFFLIANIAYFNQELAFEQTHAQTEMMVERITSLEGYTRETPVYLVGEYQSEGRDWLIQQVPERMMLDVVLDDYFLDMASVNMGMTFAKASEYEMQEVDASNELAAMPLWPAGNAVQMIHGIAVVKLSDQ